MIQSKFLYNIKRIPRDRVLFACRNYLLCKFYNSAFLDQASELGPLTHLLTLHELSQMLNDIARQTAPKSRHWVFLYPTDTSFIAKFPNLVRMNDSAMQALTSSTEQLTTPTSITNEEAVKMEME